MDGLIEWLAGHRGRDIKFSQPTLTLTLTLPVPCSTRFALLCFAVT